MADPPDIAKTIKQLAKKAVYVGIPTENDERPGEPIGNAALGYIHEFGSPARNIPARPFLNPGIKNAEREIVKFMEQAGKAAMAGDEKGVDAALAKAGIAAVNSVQAHIQAGIPPPLKQASIRKSRTKARRSGTPADATPLIDTGDLLRAITFVVRDT